MRGTLFGERINAVAACSLVKATTSGECGGMEQWYEQRQKLADKRAVVSRELRTLGADLTQRVKGQKPDPVSNGTPVSVSENTSGAPGFALKNFRGVGLTVTLKDESDELTVSPPVTIDQHSYSTISGFTDDGFVFLRSTDGMDADVHVQRSTLMDALVLTAVELKKHLQ